MRFSPVAKAAPRTRSIALIWVGVGLFDATQTFVVMRSEGMIHNWPRLVAATFLSWLPWALATPWVLRLGRCYPLQRAHSFVRAFLVHVPACLFVGVVYS